jgi:hypothetical protein
MNKIYWNTDTNIAVDIGNIINKKKLSNNCIYYTTFGVTTVDFSKAPAEAEIINECDADVIKCTYIKKDGKINLKMPVVDADGNEIVRDIQSLMFAAEAVKHLVKVN